MEILSSEHVYRVKQTGTISVSSVRKELILSILQFPNANHVLKMEFAMEVIKQESFLGSGEATNLQ
jgi:hypothetical protein